MTCVSENELSPQRVEKINVAGLKAKRFGGSDFIFMGSVYPTNEEPSLALLLNLSDSCAEMRNQVANRAGFAGNTDAASVKYTAGNRSETYPPLGEKFERNG